MTTEKTKNLLRDDFILDNFLDELHKLISTNSEDGLKRILIQDILSPYPQELFNAVEAVSIPHWFDEPFLNALMPETNKDEGRTYEVLQNQSDFVENFSKRKSRINDAPRRSLTNQLWENERDTFMMLSTRAADYLGQLATDDDIECKVEWLYHLVVVEPDKATDEIKLLGSSWNNSFRYSDLEFLANTLFEQVKANRVTGLVKSVILYRKGKVSIYLKKFEEAIDLLTQAKELVEFYCDNDLYADILGVLGEAYQLIGDNTRAIELYNTSLDIYRESKDAIGQANILKLLGKISESKKQYEEALDYYNNALILYEEGNSLLGMANTLMEIGDLEKTKGIKTNNYQKALNLYKKINDFLGRKVAAEALAKRRPSPEPSRRKQSPQSKRKNAIPSPREIPDLVREPIVTEKAIALLEHNKYTFKVILRATKLDVKISIQELFGVTVVKVNTMNPPRKERRVGKFVGSKPRFKKAIVTLAEGDSIPLFPEV